MRQPATWQPAWALRIPVAFVLALSGLEAVAMSAGIAPGWALVAACLVPWRALAGLGKPDGGSTEAGWRLLGAGIALAALGTRLGVATDAPMHVVLLVPVLATVPVTCRGAWIALVRPAASVVGLLDVVLVSLAVLLMSWPSIIDDIEGLQPTSTAAMVLVFGLVVLVAGLATTSAILHPTSRVELIAFALAMGAFAAALVVPGGGASEAYGALGMPTLLGYALAVFAIVRGQLNSSWTPPSEIADVTGGTAAVSLLVVAAFVVNRIVTERAGIPPGPLEGALQSLLLAAVAARVYVTSRAVRRVHDQLDRTAHTDALTGLGNRRSSTGRLQALLDDAAAGRGRPSIAMIDLDHFKAVNDSRGHDIGDLMLREAARRISAASGAADVVRFGGDEFLVVMPPSTVDPVGVAEGIRRALCAPVALGDRRLRMAASVGLVTATEEDDATTLVRDADVALYQAKALGRNRVVAFDHGLRETALRRLMIENGLRSAVDDGSLSLRYQPVVRAPYGDVVGAEALLRWHDPALGPVSPAEFIPVAEEIGAIVPIGLWVIDRVCQDLAALDRRAGGRTVPRVSVNVSAVQLLTADLVPALSERVAAAGLSPDRLTVEVTESALLDTGGTAAATLHDLRASGFRLAVDDFGTGYSALSYLESFPIDVLKIDRSFVTRLAEDGVDGSMIPTVVRIADLLGLVLVAEGVEVESERDALIDMGCVLHQGYLYARPMTVDELAGRIGVGVAA